MEKWDWWAATLSLVEFLRHDLVWHHILPSSAGTNEVSGWQGWELLSQQINLPLALYNGSKAVWNEGDLLWVWWVWEKVPFGAARSGNQLDAPQDALVAGWSNVHWNGPLAISARPNTLSQYFSLLSERFFCFQNLFLKYKLNQRKTAFEGCGVVLFLPLRNSGGGCVVEYSSANHQSSALFQSPLPPEDVPKQQQKLHWRALMASSALLPCSLGGHSVEAGDQMQSCPWPTGLKIFSPRGLPREVAASQSCCSHLMHDNVMQRRVLCFFLFLQHL